MKSPVGQQLGITKNSHDSETGGRNTQADDDTWSRGGEHSISRGRSNNGRMQDTRATIANS